MNPQVDTFFENAKKWQDEMFALRKIALECGLTEELKYKQPCYTFQNTNLFIISSFKEHCVLSFLKGVLLSDSEGILTKPGENSQSVRFAKFTNLQDILDCKATLKAYIFEAIEVEKQGLKVPKNNLNDIQFIDELTDVLEKDADFKTAFESLTPGRQRAYNMFFEGSKNPKTRIGRIQKYYQRIMSGKGMNDCTCGLSHRMPNCDGSHKYINSENSILKI